MTPIFTPTAKQRELHDLIFSPGNDETLYGGARGGAKTIGICWIAFELAVIFPGIRLCVCRKDFNDLKETTMREFELFMARYYSQIPLKWNRTSPATCRLDINGTESSILFAEAKDPVSLRSQNLGALIIEEGTEVSEEFYLEVSAALRCAVEMDKVPEAYRHLLSPDPLQPGWAFVPKRVIIMTNPGPGWLKREFPVGNGKKPARRTVEKCWVDRETALPRKASIRRIFLPAFIRDNPHLPPDYEDGLRARYGESYARRMIEGDWSAFEGQVFVEFDPEVGGKHVRAAYAVDAMACGKQPWTQILTGDWGYVNPAVFLRVGIDSRGCFGVWGEYRACQRTPEEHAPHLQDFIRDMPRRIDILDAAAVDQSDGITLREQFNTMEGYEWRFTGARKRKHGPEGSILFLKNLMRSGLFWIDERCVGLIRELSEAQWEPQSVTAQEKANPVERMVDKDDHGIDALFGAIERYRLAPGEYKHNEEAEARQILRHAQTEARSNVLRRRDVRTGGYVARTAGRVTL